MILQYTGNKKKRKHLKNSQYSRKMPVLNFLDYFTVSISKPEWKDADTQSAEQNRNPACTKYFLAKVQNQFQRGKNGHSMDVQK